MPWKDTRPVDQRLKFIEARLSGEYSMVTLVIGARRRHPTWGPRKLRAWLQGKGYNPLAASTIGDILRREGLVRPKRRRSRPGCFSDGLSAQNQPNAVWAADFKGHFKLRTGAKCYPLTISDGFSRYLLRCEALRHPPEYGDDVVVYRVKPNGAIAHEGRDVLLSSTLRGEPVGLSGREDGSWKIHYGPLYLGSLSAKGRLTRGRKRRRRAKPRLP